MAATSLMPGSVAHLRLEPKLPPGLVQRVCTAPAVSAAFWSTFLFLALQWGGAVALLTLPVSLWAQDGPQQSISSPGTATTAIAIGGAAGAASKVALQASQKPAASTAVKPSGSRPAWSELTPTQQQALKPLANSWDTIREAQKRKWLEISKNYSSLPPDDQAVLHSRMNEWVTLSPEQRAQARLNFAKTTELSRELTPEEKKAKWQAYQALDAEEKARLAAKAAPRPAGAATAVKPVAPQKLVVIPARSGAKPVGEPATPKMPVAPSN